MRDHYSITFAPLSTQVLIYTAVSHYILFKFSDKQLHVRDAVLMSNTGAQDYKENDKLDSKQISDSAFGAHLSFYQK